MGLVTPSIGLLFWMTIAFLLLLFVLKKLAWGPILNTISERETTINEALQSAEKAKEELKNLTATNEKLLAEARLERDAILKEAREAKDAILLEAKTKAQEEGSRLITIARETINNEKMAAVTELKNEVAQLSLEISKKVLRKELSSDVVQAQLSEQLLSEFNPN